MWLLNYLLARAGRVISLVGTYFDRVISAARFALGWAINEAAKAFSRAKAFAINFVNAAKAFLSSVISVVRSLAVQLWNDAKAKAIALFNIAKAVASLAIAALRGFLLGQINNVRAFVINLVNGVKALLDAAFKAALTLALKPIQWVIDERQNILSLLDIFSPTNRAKILDFFANGFQSITFFFGNPLGFLISFWRGFMLTFLDYALGYALGTVKLNLPPWPDWGDVGGPPGPGPGPGPGPIPGELAAPLSSLRISGHRFGPGHVGLDLGCSGGQPVFAMHGGFVEHAKFSTTGYGENVTLRSSRWWTRYAHLVRNGIEAGDAVVAGQVIGLCDSTGNSTGNHLHLEIKKNGVFQDPAKILGLT